MHRRCFAALKPIRQLPIVSRVKHSGNPIVGFCVERSGRTARLMCRTRKPRKRTRTETQMFRTTVQRTAAIVSDAARAPASVLAIGDWHDVTGHHRYYGSSACNGGERIVETRREPRPRTSTSVDSSRDKNPIDDLASAFE
jgi:hypothetical protein